MARSFKISRAANNELPLRKAQFNSQRLGQLGFFDRRPNIQLEGVGKRVLEKGRYRTGTSGFQTSPGVAARSDGSYHLAVSRVDLDSVTFLNQPITEYRLVEFTFTFGLEASSISAESET